MALTMPPLDEYGERHEWVMERFGSGPMPDWDLDIIEYPSERHPAGTAQLKANITDQNGLDGWENVTPDEIRKIADDYEAFPDVLRRFADRFEEIRADFLRRHPDGIVNRPLGDNSTH